MRAERVLLETDDQGNLIGTPQLPPNTRLEVIFLVLEEQPKSPTTRRPHPTIAGKAQTLGDLVTPIVDGSDWECLR